MKTNKHRKHKIFRLKNGTVQVYNFEPLNPEIALFRLQEMKKIPEDEQVLKRDYNRSWFARKNNDVFECESYVIKKEPIKSFEQKEDNYFFVRRYTEGLLMNASVHAMKRCDKEGEELFIVNPKDGTPCKKIQITPELYLEFLLENERFAAKALQKKDLTHQKPLFNISDEPIMECDLDFLESLLESGLVRGDFDSKLELLEGSTKVYEKLKK